MGLATFYSSDSNSDSGYVIFETYNRTQSDLNKSLMHNSYLIKYSQYVIIQMC